jgi:hypothetical protein
MFLLGNIPASVRNLAVAYKDFNTDMIFEFDGLLSHRSYMG